MLLVATWLWVTRFCAEKVSTSAEPAASIEADSQGALALAVSVAGFTPGLRVKGSRIGKWLTPATTQRSSWLSGSEYEGGTAGVTVNNTALLVADPAIFDATQR